MQNVLKPRFRLIVPSHWQTQKKSLNFQHLVIGSYYTAPGYNVVYDVFVLFAFVKVEVVWFGTFVSDQSLALLHFLLIY